MSRSAALALSFIVLEALALFVVDAVLAGTADRSALVFPAFLAAELGSFLLVKGLLHVDLSRRALIGIGSAVSIVVLVTIAGLAIDPASFPPGWAGVGRFLTDPSSAEQGTNAAEVYGVLLLVLAWVRGVMVAQHRIERATAMRSFSVGLVVLVAGLLFGQESMAKGAVDGAAIPIVAAGLLTLTLIHLRDARPSAGAELRGPWVAIALGTVAALAVVGGALGVLPLGPLGFVYDHALGPVIELALFVIAWALIIVSFPFAWLISQILTRIIGHAQLPQQQQQAQNQQQNVQKQLQHHGAPAAVFVVLAKLIVVLIVLALVAYLAYRLFNRLHRPYNEGEEREALQHEGSLRGDLLSLLRGLRPHRPAILSRAAEPELPPGVLEVRRLYLRLLELAAERGRERAPAATPEEFEPQLEDAVPIAAATGVTNAFVRARYGMQAPNAAELAALRRDVQEAERQHGPATPAPSASHDR